MRPYLTTNLPETTSAGSRRRSPTCVIHAPAKLNLCLELLGRRSDRFHELRTVMGTIRLRDTLRVDAQPETDQLTLRLAGASRLNDGVPTDASNLILQALARLREQANVEQGADVLLAKRIPHQAGLGGGSSDAAAALLAGNRVWQLDWSLDRLAELGGRLGSDVPFFVYAIGHSSTWAATATGRGEQIEPIAGAASGWPVVVVKPPEGLSTADVFGQCRSEDYRPEGPDRCEATREALKRGSLRALSEAAKNGLQAAAIRHAPWLKRLVERFDASDCAFHQLSGSGTAYFGMTRTMSEARRLAARLTTLRIGQVLATTFG